MAQGTLRRTPGRAGKVGQAHGQPVPEAETLGVPARPGQPPL